MSQPSTDVKTGAGRVIYVELERALVRTDLTIERLAMLVRAAPLKLFAVLGGLLRGHDHFHKKLAEASPLDVPYLPYQQGMIEHLKNRQDEGDVLVLASRVPEARAIADHVGVFSDVVVSLNARRLRRSAPEVVAHAADREVLWYGNVADFRRAGAQHGPSDVGRPSLLRAYLKAIRPHQWLKNILVFVPLLAAHRLNDLAALGRCAVMFAAFCLCASAIYLFNDLMDLASDRRHPRKRQRPLASGALPLRAVLIASPVMLAIALGIAGLLGWQDLGVLAIYGGLSIAYSLVLKAFIVADVITLAILYTMRVLAGGVVADVELSFWLLAFSMCVFFSLAQIKRCSELTTMSKANRRFAAGRDYGMSDLMVVQTLGIVSAFAAVLVFAMYINSQQVAAAYSRPRLLWLACPAILYWLSRMWIKTARGEMDDDPLVYTVRDVNSFVTLGLAAAFVVAAV